MGGKEDLGPEEIVGVEGKYNSKNTSWGYFFRWEMENEDMVYEMRFETGEQRTLVASEVLFYVWLESVLIVSEEEGLEAPRFSTSRVRFRVGIAERRSSRCHDASYSWFFKFYFSSKIKALGFLEGKRKGSKLKRNEESCGSRTLLRVRVELWPAEVNETWSTQGRLHKNE